MKSFHKFWNYWRGRLICPSGWNLCRIGRQFPSVDGNRAVCGKWCGLGDCLLFHSLLAGWGMEGDLGNSVSIALHNLTLPGPGGESREGGCVLSLLCRDYLAHGTLGNAPLTPIPYTWERWAWPSCPSWRGCRPHYLSGSFAFRI